MSISDGRVLCQTISQSHFHACWRVYNFEAGLLMAHSCHNIRARGWKWRVPFTRTCNMLSAGALLVHYLYIATHGTECFCVRVLLFLWIFDSSVFPCTHVIESSCSRTFINPLILIAPMLRISTCCF